MDKILHDPKDPKLWELWYIPYGSCRILSINRWTLRVSPFPRAGSSEVLGGNAFEDPRLQGFATGLPRWVRFRV